MLDRFPGTKWVVHNGWYSYNGRQYSGWYFCSIPANTIIPVSEEDLQLLTVVSGQVDALEPELDETEESKKCCPRPPFPPPRPPFPPPGPYVPVPPDPCPRPPFPPGPGPIPPSVLAKLIAEMEGAFITVPTLEHRDALYPSEDLIPDGKLVRVNSVSGETVYYVWNKYGTTWQVVDFEPDVASDIDEALTDYYTKSEIDAKETVLQESIQSVDTSSQTRDDEISETLETSVNDLLDRISAIDSTISDIEASMSASDADLLAKINEAKASITAINSELLSIRSDISDRSAYVDNALTKIESDVDALENSVYSIGRVSSLTDNNSILVIDDGTIKDSGYLIGDDEIGEPSEYADSKTLATEKAVARKVEEAIPKWQSF